MSDSGVVVSTTCYRPDTNGTIEGISSNYYTPKTNTNYSPCCFSASVYIEDNVCYQADAAVGSAGYYMALCTDPTYKDPSCAQACGMIPHCSPMISILTIPKFPTQKATSSTPIMNGDAVVQTPMVIQHVQLQRARL